MKLYRVQHKEYGIGPYRLGSTRTKDIHEMVSLKNASNDIGEISEYFNPGPNEEYQSLFYNFSGGLEFPVYGTFVKKFEEVINDDKTKFCFKSKRKLMEWFNHKLESNNNVLDILHRNNFEVVVYETNKKSDVIHLGTQSIFRIKDEPIIERIDIYELYDKDKLPRPRKYSFHKLHTEKMLIKMVDAMSKIVTSFETPKPKPRKLTPEEKQAFLDYRNKLNQEQNDRELKRLEEKRANQSIEKWYCNPLKNMIK